LQTQSGIKKRDAGGVAVRFPWHRNF
jgi:hypothetical protein